MVRLLDKNVDGDCRDSGELFWQLSDAQFSTVAVIDQNAVLQERVNYTSYGVGTHRWPHEVNNTGGVTTSGSTSDYGVIDGLAQANSGAGTPINDPNGNYNVAADLNRDGVIDSTDTSIFTSTFGGAKSALASGLISDPNGPDNVFGYDGYVYNADQGLYTVRFRWYSPTFGRWMERDPLGLPAGMNVNEYASGRPSFFDDPLGLYADDDSGIMDSVIRWIIHKLGGEGSPELTRQFQEGIRQRRELTNDADPIIKDAAEQCACDAENYQKAMGEVARQAAAQVLTYPFGGDGLGNGIGSAKALTESLIHLAESAPQLAGSIVVVFVKKGGNTEEVLGLAFQVMRNAKGEPVSPSTGWASFDALKAALPKPPSDCWVYHHIVEKCQELPTRSGFAANRVHSVGNVVVVPRSINQELANFYNSAHDFTGKQILRDWLNGQSWEFQQQLGEELLARALCGTLR